MVEWDYQCEKNSTFAETPISIMLILIHQKAQKLIGLQQDDEDRKILNSDLCRTFWDLAEQHPEDLICWCEESFIDDLERTVLKEIFPNDLIMASYALHHSYFPEQIGYIDQLPFINVNREVRYGTWRMSTDAGGIKGKVLIKFRKQFDKVKDFSFLINSIAKIGQYNGLFCFSDPRFFQGKLNNKYVLQPVANTSQLFAFVYMYYKTVRVWLLLFCFFRYERSLPLIPFLKSFFSMKSFLKEIDLSSISLNSPELPTKQNNVDVIIPTLRRREYLLQVLEDLKNQTLLPKKVIVVEQNSDPDSLTELPELKSNSWPFEIVHHFIHKTGACTARNIALEEVSAEWVFFADDDIRFESELLKSSLLELNRLGVDCLNLSTYQIGENKFFNKIKQWGSFGSGLSIVNSLFAREIKFLKVFEYGFGEDQDYGMQLRYAGCDIIYHPDLEILHLKAPRGGFRDTALPPWKQDDPKPSPTIMLFAQKYFTKWQMRGFKTELFLRNYDIKKNINPLKYWKNMKLRWAASEDWAKKTIAKIKLSE